MYSKIRKLLWRLLRDGGREKGRGKTEGGGRKTHTHTHTTHTHTHTHSHTERERGFCIRYRQTDRQIDRQTGIQTK